MANVTQSLFPALGDLLSPSLESVYAQQFQQASRPGDAMQAATGLITGAGTRLNQGISNLFGQQPQAFAERDKLRAITAGLQQQGVDVTTPEGMLQLAQTLDQFPEFTEGALRLRQQAAMMAQQRQQEALKQRLTEAQIGTEAFRQTKLAAEAEAKLREPATKENILKPSQEFASTGLSLGITPKPNLADYTPEESAKIQAQIQKNRESTARAGTPAPASGEVKIPDLTGAQTLVKNLVGGSKDKLDTVKDIRTQLNLAKRGEGAALPQLQRLLAKLVGDSQIAQSETVQALGSAGIVGNTISSVNQFMTGLPTQDKLNSVEQVVDALENINAQSYNSNLKQAAAVLAEARLPESARKALLPPAYKTGKQKKTQFVEGKIYKDANGNRARYVDGKWEPVQ